MGRHWRAWFGTLPADCRLLDIGTGTGILLRHALAARPNDAGLRCDGIDAAALPPNLQAGFPSERAHQVVLRGSVPAETLPYVDACFDAVVSQFGVEYADLPVALKEIVRVLAPGGRIALLMHHREGRPVALARAERNHAAWVLDTMLPAATAMATAMSLFGTEEGRRELRSNPLWSAVRRRYDLVLADARDRCQAGAAPDLLVDVQRWCAEAFRVAVASGADAGEAAIAEVGRLVRDHDTRLEDLLAHALDAHAAAAVSRVLHEAGLKASSPAPVKENQHLMGWWIEALAP
jgi:SAM-dependent methyltransferase